MVKLIIGLFIGGFIGFVASGFLGFNSRGDDDGTEN